MQHVSVQWEVRCPFLKLFVQIPQPRFQSMSDSHNSYFCFQAPEPLCIQEMAATQAACDRLFKIFRDSKVSLYLKCTSLAVSASERSCRSAHVGAPCSSAAQPHFRASQGGSALTFHRYLEGPPGQTQSCNGRTEDRTLGTVSRTSPPVSFQLSPGTDCSQTLTPGARLRGVNIS